MTADRLREIFQEAFHRAGPDEALWAVFNAGRLAHGAQSVASDDYVALREVVAARHGLTGRQILDTSEQGRHHILARAELAWILRECAGLPFTEVAGICGYAGRQAATYACRSLAKQIASNPSLGVELRAMLAPATGRSVA